MKQFQFFSEEYFDSKNNVCSISFSTDFAFNNKIWHEYLENYFMVMC